jgi:hypothetical protein
MFADLYQIIVSGLLAVKIAGCSAVQQTKMVLNSATDFLALTNGS